MSGRTQYYCATSLDGFIAEADDTLEWLTGYDGAYDGPGAEPMKGSYDRFYEDVGAMVSGSVTYEWVLNHVEKWAYREQALLGAHDARAVGAAWRRRRCPIRPGQCAESFIRR